MWLFNILLTLVIYFIFIHSTVSGCYDSNRYCSDWSRKGECSRNRAYMKLSCKKSCGYCRTAPQPRQVSAPAGCVNRNRYCESWKNSGECSRNPKYMKVNCKKSCGLCSRPRPRPKPPQRTRVVAVNGKYGAWSKWEKCSKSCGKGLRWRTRQCNNPAPRNNGKYCAGSARTAKECNTKNCPINGKYGVWSKWGKCSKMCGTGTRWRTRKCDRPAAKYNGKKCVGSAKQGEYCNTKMCPDKSVDGKYGKWSSWTKCSKACGSGGRTRARKCDKPARRYRGKKCVGSSTEAEFCNTKKCSSRSIYGKWSSWSKCTKACGRGKRLRERKCKKSAGKKCVAPDIGVGFCNVQKCRISISGSKFPVNHPNCGKQFQIGRIIGGKIASYGDWPWQVAIAPRGNEGFVFCGGTLINSRTVLTAAHCFRRTKKPVGSKFVVRVGDLNLDAVDGGEKVVKVKRIIKHQGFNKWTYLHDIAVMILEEDVTDGRFVGHACLAVNGDVPPVDKKCVITGWGRLAEAGIMATRLQQAKVPIVSTKTCNKSYKDRITSGMMCAGYPEGAIDSCQGDSGGPLVCLSKGKFVLQGIISWGAGCAQKGFYGVYTKVSAYEDWIKKALSGKL